MVLDVEITKEVDKMIQHYTLFRNMGVQKKGLEEQKGWDIGKIETLCAIKDYTSKPYIRYYEKGISE